MLHDAARKGDVEIPVFCYEPKLGDPVGACRMCLVEIEGIPKLQTSCSTPVRDGMVVHTRTEQVKHAQSAVVEFLLVNHPLDCPVCDKGGECPLQDITQGWGPGKSRVIDEKRHFREADRALAAGRDRPRALHPLLPLRALQPGGLRGRPAAAARARRPHLRRHLRRPPLRRPLPRQHHRALPGRGADQLHLPLPRPALGHRAGRLGLHALPEPVQRQLHGPRREGETGARPRQRRGRRRLALRPRPLRLRDVRRREAGRRAAAERRRRDRAGRRRSRPPPRACAPPAPARSRRSSATPPTRRATWSSACCARRSAPRTSTRAPRAAPAARRWSRLAQPELSAAGPRHRRRRRDPRPRHRPAAQLADPRPADPQGDPPQRRQAGRRDRAPDRARRRRRGDRPLRARRGRPLRLRAGRGAAGGAENGRRRRWPRACATPSKVVVIWGERIARDGDGAGALLDARRRPRASPSTEGAGLLEVPDFANARGLREAGCLPDAGPGLDRDRPPRQVDRGDPRRPGVRRAQAA